MQTLIKKILFISFLLIAANSNAQSKKVWLYTADELFAKQDYNNALIYYRKVLNDTIFIDERILPYEAVTTNQRVKTDAKMDAVDRSVPLAAYVNHKTALCYTYIFDYENSLEHLKISTSSGYYPEDNFPLANAQMNMAQYSDAIITFENFIKEPGVKDSLLTIAQVLITGCYYAQKDGDIKTEAVVEMCDTNVFNKGTASFGTMYYKNEDKIMFASAREGGVLLDPEKQQSEFLLDLYYTSRDDEGEWERPKNFGRPMNSAQHDASGAPTNKNAIFFTRWSDESKDKKSIYVGREINMLFFESFKLGPEVNVDGFISINPFVSLDGKTLFFSSNRPGGLGGMDLWTIELDSNGNTMGQAINLGLPINSELDEVTPFFHEQSSTFFYSSNGHITIGGLDILKSAYNKETKVYGKPENMGTPINSPKDDAYLIFDRNLRQGFFSSDREPCEGGHCYDIYSVKNEPIQIFLTGTVYDANTNQPLRDANVTLKDINGEFKNFVLITKEDGKYFQELPQNAEVFAKAQKIKYFADAASVDSRPYTVTTTLTQDFYLNKIPNEEIEIEGIEYDFDSDKLRPISMAILDKLYEFLELNDNIIVDVYSHTDARGSDKYNQSLSERRAKSCVNYLISKGLNKDRILAKGFGESQPAYLKDENKDYVLDANGNRIQLTEEYINAQPTEEERELLHQRNRRTAFKVVGEGYVNDSL